MKYNDTDQRGVFDHSFKPIKLNFHRQSLYETVLEKLKRIVLGTEDKGGITGGTYFLADASGVSIQQNHFEIQGVTGKLEVLPWTLENYVQVSGVRYPSKTRLYCVIIEHGKEVEALLSKGSQNQ